MSTNAPHTPDPRDPSNAARDDARLQDLLDGRLDDDAADALRARLAAEPALRESWDELRGIQALVRGYGPAGADLDLPDDFLARVKTRIGAAAPTASGDAAVSGDAAAGEADGPGAAPKRRPRRMLQVLTVGYAAAALLVVGFTVRYVLTDASSPAGPVRTAQEDFERDAPSEAPDADGVARRLDEARDTKTDTKTDAKTDAGQAAAREKQRARGLGQDVGQELDKSKAKRDGGRNDLEKPEGGAEPAGALEGFGMRRAGSKTGAPEPAVGGGQAGGGKIAGRYGAPGGAVHPGARPLPGAQPRGRRGGARDPLAKADVARKEKLARLLADGDGPVYVLEVDDASQARAAVAALLEGRASASVADDLPREDLPREDLPREDLPRDGRPAAGKAKSTDPKPDDSSSPLRKRGAPDAPPAAEEDAAPVGRLYRVDAAQAGRLILALRSQAPANGQTAAEAESKDAGDGSRGLRLALLDVVTPELDATALARLDRRALSGVWGGEPLARLVKKTADAGPQAARPTPGSAAPVPTTPAPPTSPRAPAPRKPAGDAPAGDAPASDDEAEPAKAPAPKAQRVRILVLERR